MSEPALVAADAGLSEVERCERLCEVFKNTELPEMRRRLLAPLEPLLTGTAPEGELAVRALFFVGTTWRAQVAKVSHLSSLRRILCWAISGKELSEGLRAALALWPDGFNAAHRELLAAVQAGTFPPPLALRLLTLEAAALRFRSQHLAEVADPYSMRAMARLLPRLRLYDELADRLDLLAGADERLAEPDLGTVHFLEEKEFGNFCRTLASLPGLSALPALFELQRRLQWEPEQISGLFTVSRTLSLCGPGWMEQLAFWFELARRGLPLHLPVTVKGESARKLARGGVKISGAGLEIDPAHLEPAKLLTGGTLSQSLLQGRQPPPPDWKSLVLCNITRDTLIMAILGNPRATRVPGLVEMVVTSSHSSQILSFIARSREFCSGPANRGVPSALLRSRVKVPMSLLRRFIHVRYITRADLKDLAVRAPRPEVAREVADYLASI